ncbi:hypothetical protein PG623_08145 [Riemerella anatipestifer]|uniref:hypothetical protein n=1 Tax=Riemerella anatipestifer TaxID=34085 RepID=UPI001374D18D|nr:hypothetical protein [Riemerella anatipestifer]MDY3363968.1 hypothetical protein [Riemerella anatipestifer]
MKGILKIYHPEETLKYHFSKTYCKSVLSNDKILLEVELITSEDMDHVEDDSLQYRFPQLALNISDFPIASKALEGQTFNINNEEELYAEINLYDDDETELLDNQLSFSLNDEGVLQLIWEGEVSDFYTNSDEPLSFKLKCHFKEDSIEIED